jgi:2-polyprenyl-3-methyl-5-hydroxy-6-metoxy-1,4-benzoquinol methylase
LNRRPDSVRIPLREEARADGRADYKKDWDRLAHVDAEWSIVSRIGRRRRDRTPWTRAEFLATGEVDAREILQKIGMESVEGLRILEVGCGAGRLLRAFAQRGAVVTGVDVSPRMLELAAGNCEEFRNNVSLYNGDGETLKDISDNTFDIVYTWHVLQHVPDRKVVMRLIGEIHRALKAGATALLHLPERSARNLRWRAYKILTRFGVSADPTGWFSAIPMFGIPREEVMSKLAALGVRSVETLESGRDTFYVIRK